MLPLAGPLLYLTSEPSCALNVQLFSMYSLWNNFDVSCLTLTSLSWPDPAALLKGTVNRTFCLCVSCPFVASQCANVFCCSFLTHCPAEGLPSQATALCLSKTIWVFTQKRGFLNVNNNAKCKESGETKMERRRRWMNTPCDSLWCQRESSSIFHRKEI